jgi:glucans biosynthesis protein
MSRAERLNPDEPRIFLKRISVRTGFRRVKLNLAGRASVTGPAKSDMDSETVIRRNRLPGRPGVNRRRLLLAGVALALPAVSSLTPRAAAAPAGAKFGPPQAFDFARLREAAKSLAAKAYAAPKPAPELVGKIDFDLAQKIKFRADKSLFNGGGFPFPVRLFHVDKFNQFPVKIFMLSGNAAHELVYSTQDFDYGDTGLDKKLPADLGFSGFRVMDGPEGKTDWLAFQGASYFRSAGQNNQYGASARGIAVNTTASSKEEFPRFTAFWLAEPDPQEASITVYALLDGPSLTGAYRFIADKQAGVVMRVEHELFIRNDIAQLGIAPLTSMYWYDENDRQFATDWRPEIHDSDGLALWTGKGEHIWRPLIDPPSVKTNSFLDQHPKGFGLMQRDRSFSDYQDDGAFYNRRPSIWVEPLGGWGAGAVQLVEIPTRDEIHDNVVAFWKTKRAVKAGDHLKFAYKLYWKDDNPHPPTEVGRVTATRIGRGGVPGKPASTDKDSWKIVIDFMGGPLAGMKPRYDIKPIVNVSRGKISNAYVIKVVGTERWRAAFDVYAPGKQQIDLRCLLQLGDRTLTETWLYQYFPPDGAA